VAVCIASGHADTCAGRTRVLWLQHRSPMLPPIFDFSRVGESQRRFHEMVCVWPVAERHALLSGHKKD
jgi:hypothetical protein